ncbi:MAG: N-acetylmuramoyl-L-alanine amidase [Eubacteriales bacterium]|nr:N-acetylmuramoyl-L-alanine amidase [Eubacteriales bacterium]
MKRTVACFCLLVLTLCGCSAREMHVVATAAPTATPVVAAAEPSIAPSLTPSPSPTATPAAALGPGAESDEVLALQQRLIALKYLQIQTPTRYYGSKTEIAVRAFQKQNQLPETGTADASTRQALFSEEAQPCALALSGLVIGLDPGHQKKANSDKEPVSPGSSDMKKKVSSGTQGRFTKVPEYEVVLDVALLLRDKLEAQGATVVMTRETNDVDISNVERAKLFNKSKTDYALRLHCNGSENAEKHGAFVLYPAKRDFTDACEKAGQLLIDAFCKETKAQNLGIVPRSDQTGFNWSDRMILNIEMGHMTNEKEDHLLVDSAYQEKMAQGILDGILAYFAQ